MTVLPVSLSSAEQIVYWDLCVSVTEFHFLSGGFGLSRQTLGLAHHICEQLYTVMTVLPVKISNLNLGHNSGWLCPVSVYATYLLSRFELNLSCGSLTIQVLVLCLSAG